MNFNMFSSKNKPSEIYLYGDEWEIKPTDKPYNYQTCLGALINTVPNKAKIKLLPYNLCRVHDQLGAKNNLYKPYLMDRYLDSVNYVMISEEERRYQEAKLKKNIIIIRQTFIY